jgi:hypothetical protein
MIDPVVARTVLHKLGSSGTPPEIGVETFTVGLERYLQAIEAEYLNGILRYNLSSFKLVLGNYGGGKTHFLYSVRDLAFRNNFAVAYATLSPVECPFDRLELVYRQIAGSIMPPAAGSAVLAAERGIGALIRAWHRSRTESAGAGTMNLRNYADKLPLTESSSFLNAVKAAFLALIAEDAETFDAALQWLKGEEVGPDVRARYRISERIDRSTAFRMLRSLIQWVHAIGYTGLILLFDEAERGMSISSSRDRRRALDNLRQIVDECGNSRLPGAMLFYAIPDENQLLDGTGGVYEALKQRLRSVFSEVNPVGVRIDLEQLSLPPREFLRALGQKLVGLFEAAYAVSLPGPRVERNLGLLAELALTAFAFDVSYRRLFVIGAIEVFQRLRANPEAELTRKDAEGILRVTAGRLTEDEKQAAEAEEF